jgi:hydrogenase expression/formation protein HypE
MIGKLTSEQLHSVVFKHLTYKREEVILRPSIGEDCAAVSFGEHALIISTDPITGTGSEVGKLAVNINLNDIASNGVAPIGLMMTILAPVGTPLDAIEAVMAQAGKEAEKHGVEIIGGHTEITDAVNRLVVSAVAIGSQPTKDVLSLKKIEVGDIILMTKMAGLEGTGIIAYEKADELEDILGSCALSDAKAFLDQTSVVAEGVASGKFAVHAMHDVTEGGLLGAIWELCHGAGVGCLIDESCIPVHSITMKICDYYGIDPLRLISSGALLIIVKEAIVSELTKAIEALGVSVQEIGVITEQECLIDVEGELFTIEPPVGDELYTVLGTA